MNVSVYILTDWIGAILNLDGFLHFSTFYFGILDKCQTNRTPGNVLMYLTFSKIYRTFIWQLTKTAEPDNTAHELTNLNEYEESPICDSLKSVQI